MVLITPPPLWGVRTPELLAPNLGLIMAHLRHSLRFIIYMYIEVHLKGKGFRLLHTIPSLILLL